MNVYKITYSYAAKNGQLRNGALLLAGKDVEEVHIKATQELIKQNLIYPAISNIVVYDAAQIAQDQKKK